MIPNQTKANTRMEIFNKGFSSLRNISKIIAKIVIPKINICMGISQMTAGCLTHCNIDRKSINNKIIGLAPCAVERVIISLDPSTSNKNINIENIGKLLTVSPAKIITNKEGMPRIFTNTLEDLFSTIFDLKLDKNLQEFISFTKRINELFHDGIIIRKD
jgi:hypothetical protein